MSHVVTVRGLEKHWDLGQIVHDDEGRLVGRIVVLKLRALRTDLSHLRRSSVAILCTTNVDIFKVSAIYRMIKRRSERKTLRTRFMLSSAPAVVGRPERGSSAT